MIRSPISYVGGKTRALKYIIPIVEEQRPEKVISVFIGGGSVELNLSCQVIGFDIFNLLINYWQQQITNQIKLYEMLNNFIPSKEAYKKINEELMPYFKGKEINDKLRVACLYYISHNLSYGPYVLGWYSSHYNNIERYKKVIQKVKNFNRNLEVYCDSFENVLSKYNNDFLYLDPPYYVDGDSTMDHYCYPNSWNPIHHKSFNHNLLAEMLKKHKGKFLLSYNDCSFTRENYKNFTIKNVEWTYGLNYKSSKKSSEILISNF